MLTEIWCRSYCKKYRNKTKKKTRITNIKKCGNANGIDFSKIDFAARAKKELDTKKKNKTFNSASDEKYIASVLKQKFSDLKCQYKSQRYPFMCDFYIEYQGHWTHGKHPFNENNSEDILKVKLWESKNDEYYKNTIYTWTVRDQIKRDIAQKNNLNWLEFFTLKEF